MPKRYYEPAPVCSVSSCTLLHLTVPYLTLLSLPEPYCTFTVPYCALLCPTELYSTSLYLLHLTAPYFTLLHPTAPYCTLLHLAEEQYSKVQWYSEVQ